MRHDCCGVLTKWLFCDVHNSVACLSDHKMQPSHRIMRVHCLCHHGRSIFHHKNLQNICTLQLHPPVPSIVAGNSVPDLMNNLSLARDGFPSMAVAACFAAPMFSMMVGMSAALAYGAAANHGVLLVPLVSVSCTVWGSGRGRLRTSQWL